MKPLFNLYLVLGITFFSCTKQANKIDPALTSQQTAANSVVAPMACSVVKDWKGYYSSLTAVTEVNSSTFISGGIARLGSSPYPSPYWGSIQAYSIQMDYCGFHPASLGDDITLTVRLKNPDNGPGAIPDWDVALTIIGDQNRANVTFMGHTRNQIYTSMSVGTTGVTNTPDLVYKFQDWTTVTLKTQNNVFSVYINGVLQKSINYTGLQVGMLKSVDLGFKGPGSIDWMELLQVTPGQELKMRDDFNETYGMRWWLNGTEIDY